MNAVGFRRVATFAAVFAIGAIGASLIATAGSLRAQFCRDGATVSVGLVEPDYGFEGTNSEFVVLNLERTASSEAVAADKASVNALLASPAYANFEFTETSEHGKGFVDVQVRGVNAAYFSIDEKDGAIAIGERAFCTSKDGIAAVPEFQEFVDAAWSGGELEPGDAPGLITDEELITKEDANEG